MLLQEALLRNAVKFEYDGVLRSEVAVAVMDADGDEVLDLREKWLPINIYGEDDYANRVRELMHRRYYGRDQQDKAGILRYTKVVNTVLDVSDLPAPPMSANWPGCCPSIGRWTRPTKRWRRRRRTGARACDLWRTSSTSCSVGIAMGCSRGWWWMRHAGGV